ncbi:MAG: hypothetical protein WC623_22405 [Pedobacter sp.]|uniref:hypothetical protein n=1 Tax=Pedobacter sp. TaxID=1411316 RepID=UPI003568E82E
MKDGKTIYLGVGVLLVLGGIGGVIGATYSGVALIIGGVMTAIGLKDVIVKG